MLFDYFFENFIHGYYTYIISPFFFLQLLLCYPSLTLLLLKFRGSSLLLSNTHRHTCNYISTAYQVQLVLLMCMCVGLIVWDWTTFLEAHPLPRRGLPRPPWHANVYCHFIDLV